MKKTKIPVAKFKDGDAVHSSMAQNQLLHIVGEPQWNGFTYMYAFKDTDMRCGEGYLSEPQFLKA